MGSMDRVWIQTREGKLRPVPVQLGIQDRQFAELVSGDLQEGEQVITGATASSKSPVTQQSQSPFGGGPGPPPPPR